VGPWERLPQLFAYGLVSGSVITLGAIGLSLTHSILRFANFAHGDLMTAGAYIALGFLLVFQRIPALRGHFGRLSFGPAMIPAFLLALLGTGILAIAIDRLVYRRLRRARPVMLLMLSVGVAFVLRNLILFSAGADPYYYSHRIQRAIHILGVRLKVDQVFIIALGFVLVVLLHLFLTRTRIGKAMRAMADNPELAQVTGIDTERVIAWTWGIGAALAAAGGILSGIENKLITPQLGWQALLPLFAAVVLGGIGSPYGAMAGGMLIGITQELSTAFISTAYKPAVAFGILVLMLILRPQGLFGRR